MIEGVEIKELKVVKDDRGYLMEMMRSDDSFFRQFGQVYLSVCNPGIVKGFHYHKKQWDRFVIVKGNAKIVLYDGREDSPTYKEINEFEIGEKNPILLVIPPYVYHAMTPAKDDEPIYLVNTPTEKYNYDEPDEHRAPFDSKMIGYDWGKGKRGH
ncbi:MAG: dTDP-4-dehydrorhamnose 3,5-epimerase family protein [Candidatus Diapherotrites archaeon]